MIGWPRTLLGRTALIMAAMLILSQFAALQLFRFYYHGPLLEEIAARALSQIRTIGAAIQVLRDEEREEFLDLLEARERIKVLYDNEDVLPSKNPEDDILQAFAARLRSELGAETEFFQRQTGQALWVKLPVGEEKFWIGIPLTQIERPFPFIWIGWASASALVAVAAAYLLVRRINRPLRELTAAARTLSHGEYPQSVPVRGPEEIQSVSATFNAMLEDLKRRDEERAVLLAGISHDLRTPLARMRLGIEMIEEDASAKADMIQDCIEMDAIVGQFLDFARAERDEQLAQTDLNALVREICAAYVQRGVSLRLELGEVASMRARPLALRRAFTNLVDNAIKYAGGEIEVHTAASGARASISVLDRGAGIPADQAERMLRPFTRLESARTNASGSGLGLAIVERIAKMHGGAFKLLPRPGGGLEACLELPIESA